MTRALAVALAATLSAGAFAAQPTDRAQAADPPLPEFTYVGVVADAAELGDPEVKEVIFPTIFHAGAHLANPLGEWYMYYAPHNSPGGVFLKYADSLDGPWTKWSGGRVITNQWAGIYDVSHVSSPDAIWNPADNKMYMFFHGENHIERFATTTDGINFTYGGTAVETSMISSTSREVSYGRVFAHPNPSLGNKWAMFFMENTTEGIRRIRQAVSNNLRDWTIRTDFVMRPTALDGTDISAGNLVNFGGQNYIAYHGSNGKIMARTIDPSLTTVGAPAILYDVNRGARFTPRVAAPEFTTNAGYTYLHYEVGDRLAAKIAFAKLSLADPARLSCAGAGSDEFSGYTFNASKWPAIVRPTLARHTVGGDSLRIPTYGTGVAGAPLIQQPVKSGAWQVTTAVNIAPKAAYQQAGILLWASDSTYAKLDVGHGSRGKTLEFIQRKSGSDRNVWLTDSIPAPATLGERVWLRLTSNGTQMTASYSVNGSSFVAFGQPVLLTSVPATKIGPFALRGATSAQEIAGVFDWFQWKPTAAELAAC